MCIRDRCGFLSPAPPGSVLARADTLDDVPHDVSWDEYNAHQSGRRPRPSLDMALDAAGPNTSPGDPEMTFHTEAQARALIAGLDVVSWREEDADGMAYTGPKHWHVFHVVARRPTEG